MVHAVADRRTEHGSATIWALGWMGVSAALAAVVTIGALVTARQHQVDGAADLAAIAAAAAIQRDAAPCPAARVAAAANQATLVACSADGQRVDVRTRAIAVLPFGLRVTLVGHARAGPVDGTDGVPAGRAVGPLDRPAASG
jgi:secretion/DNA translocation related TadE-like protein